MALADLDRELLKACTSLNIDYVLLTLKLGANPNYIPSYGESPLLTTLQRQVGENCQDCDGTDHISAKGEVIECLIEHGANVNLQFKDGNTVLHYLCTEFPDWEPSRREQLELIPLLLKAPNAEVDIKNAAGKDVISLASLKTNAHILPLFKDAFKKYNIKTAKLAKKAIAPLTEMGLPHGVATDIARRTLRNRTAKAKFDNYIAPKKAGGAKKK
jgi:ankyrin repeat protein